jgi:hypothetical protein
MYNGKVTLGADKITVEKVWNGKTVGTVDKWNDGACDATSANGKTRTFRGGWAETEAEKFIWSELAA